MVGITLCTGLVMYGLYPDDCVNDGTVNLKPAMKIVSHVIHVKEVPEGSGVSYGHTFFSERPTKIATVCIGYADGYSRSLSNKGYVVINGKKANIIGRVCMDQTMVDVTDIEDVKIGDEVLLFGKELPVEEIAELTNTINYEIVCGISPRVPRVIIK